MLVRSKRPRPLLTWYEAVMLKLGDRSQTPALEEIRPLGRLLVFLLDPEDRSRSPSAMTICPTLLSASSGQRRRNGVRV